MQIFISFGKRKRPTNGEVIKTLFPNIRISYDICGNISIYDGKENIINNDWWDAPFKATVTETEKELKK